MRTMVRPYGSENHDRFLRFRLFLFLGKVSANTSTVLWVSSDLEPNEREKKNLKKKKTEKKKKQRKKKTMKKMEKSKNEEINPHSKQPSSCEPKHETNFQMTNPSILLFFFVSSSPPDANSSFAFFFFFFCLSFVLIFSFMNLSCQACDCVRNDKG